MSSVALNQPVPEFQAEATGDQTVRLSDLKGRNIVIYFYPKDNTPGCTTEGQDFRDRMKPSLPRTPRYSASRGMA